MNRIPLNSLWKAMYDTLTKGQSVPVYDNVPIGAKFPYITLGALNVKDVSTKRDDLCKASITVHVWTTYKGRMQVNQIANEAAQIINGADLDLSADNFAVIDHAVDFFEAYADEDGYNAALTVNFDIQDISE